MLLNNKTNIKHSYWLKRAKLNKPITYQEKRNLFDLQLASNKFILYCRQYILK